MLNYNVKVGLFGLRCDVTPESGIFNRKKVEYKFVIPERTTAYVTVCGKTEKLCGGTYIR